MVVLIVSICYDLSVLSARVVVQLEPPTPPPGQKSAGGVRTEYAGIENPTARGNIRKAPPQHETGGSTTANEKQMER